MRDINLSLQKLYESAFMDERSVRVNLERRKKNPEITGVTKPELAWQGKPEALAAEIEKILKGKSPKFTILESDFMPLAAFRMCQTCLYYKPDGKLPDGQCLYRQSETDNHVTTDPILDFRVRPDGVCDGWTVRQSSWRSPLETPQALNLRQVLVGFANTQPARNYQNVLDGRPWKDKTKDKHAIGYLNNAICRNCASCRFFSFPSICQIIDVPVSIISFCHLYTEVLEVRLRPHKNPHLYGNTTRLGPDEEFKWTEEQSDRNLAGTED